MNKTTLEHLNQLLALYGAVISTKNSLPQPKAEGYIGDQWVNSSKPVRDFQIVSVKDGSSFANVDSNIYKTIDENVLNEVHNSYYETNKTIYC